MGEKIRLSVSAALVLRVFLEDPAVPRYGFDLMEATGLPSGTIYPILARFERAGWMVGAREDINPRVEGRPARHYYMLTSEGAHAARQWLDELIEMLK